MRIGQRRLAWVAAASVVALGVGGWLLARKPPGKPEAGPALTLQVVGANGAALRGAKVVLAGGLNQVNATAGLNPLKATTDAQGEARLDTSTLRGTAMLTIEASSFARAVRDVAIKSSPERLRVVLQPEALLSGVVVDETGAPVPGARVLAQLATLSAARDANAASEAQCDAQGQFALKALAAGSYAVQASAELHETAVVPNAQAPGTAIRIVLERTSALRGDVLGIDGRPAARALVTAAGSGLWPPRRFEADARGHFELTPLPAGVYELRAALDGAVSEPEEGIVLEPAAASSVRLQLTAGATLRGRVQDRATHAPLADAAVSVVEDALSATPALAKTNARGEFSVGGLRALPHRIWIRLKGYVPLAGTEVDPSQSVASVLQLDRAGALAGVVVSEDGKPIADAELEIVGTTATRAPLRMSAPALELGVSALPPPAADNLGVTNGPIPKVPLIAGSLSARAFGSEASAPMALGFHTDADGHFRIEDVPPGKLQVFARHAGLAQGSTPVQVLAAGGVIENLRIELTRGIDLVGRVLDARGFPVPGVRVQLMIAGEPSARVTVSADDGGFGFEAVRGAADLTALPIGEPEVRQKLTLEGSGQREVVLTLGGEARSLAGRVVDGRGFPIEVAVVHVEGRDPKSPSTQTTTTGADGTFRVTGLPAPPYRITVEHPQYAQARLDSVTPQPHRELQIELAPGVVVSGEVLDRMEGTAIEGARVRLSGPKGSAKLLVDSDAQGRFEFRNVIPGDYSVSVQHAGHVPGSAKTLIRGGQDQQLEPLLLDAAGAVSGDVVDRLGSPVAGAQIAAGDPPAWGHAARSDAQGHFLLHGLEAGEQPVSARHPSAGESAQPVIVRIYAQQESPGLVLRLPELAE